MSNTVQILDVVALVEDLPQYGLRRDRVGTVVDVLATDVFEVDFSDNRGHTYIILNLHAQQLMVLDY